MKLFDRFEAVRFPEEDMIFIANEGDLRFIYDHKRNWWHKNDDAVIDSITVENYQEIDREELVQAMGGTFPCKETDFLRLFGPARLSEGDMLELFLEDYPDHMADRTIDNAVRDFLRESRIPHKAYLGLRKIFDQAVSGREDNGDVLKEIKELSFVFLGRDIFKPEIGLIDGHDSTSYFWVMPVRIIDYRDTNGIFNVAEMRKCEISIEENDVDDYLSPYLLKYFDDKLLANRKRVADHREVCFEWNLTYNFYTYDTMEKVIADIEDTICALSTGGENEYTAKLMKKKIEPGQMIYVKARDRRARDDAWQPSEDDATVDMLIDFYRRFIYRMKYMMTVGRENGFDLISFMGP